MFHCGICKGSEAVPLLKIGTCYRSGFYPIHHLAVPSRMTSCVAGSQAPLWLFSSELKVLCQHEHALPVYSIQNQRHSLQSGLLTVHFRKDTAVSCCWSTKTVFFFFFDTIPSVLVVRSFAHTLNWWASWGGYGWCCWLPYSTLNSTWPLPSASTSACWGSLLGIVTQTVLLQFSIDLNHRAW